MILLVAMLLAQGQPPTAITARQGKSLDGGFTAWAVECVSGCSGSGGVSSTVAISGQVGVNILDAGAPININLPATAATAANQNTGNASLSSIDGKTATLVSGRVPVDPSGVISPVSLSSVPTHAVTESGVWTVSVNILDAGPPLNVNFPASQAVTGPLTDTQMRASVVPVYVDGGTILATQGTSPWVVSGPVTDTQLRASVVPVYVDGGTILATQGTSPWTVSGTVTTTPPSNASTNVAQFGGTNVATGTGTGGAGIPRVTISSDSSLAANQSVNVAQVNGVATSTGVGASGTGTQRNACLVHDGTTVAGVIVATTALKTDLSSVAGTATATGNGTASGSIRVSVASDSTGTIAATESGTWTVQPGNTANTTPWLATARVVGNTGAVVDAANNAAAPANVLAVGFEAATQGTTQPTAATAGNMRRNVISTDGVQYVRPGGPVSWSCFLQAITATTVCRAAPAAGLKAYVTSLQCDNQAATVQTIDVVFGTTAACASGTTALTHKFQMGTNATTTSPDHVTAYFPAGLVPTAANGICVRPSAATAFGCTLTGYDAP